jgi:hypothetical protein
LDTPENLKKLTQEYKAIDFYFDNDVDIINIEKLTSVIEVQKVKEGFHVIVEDIHESVCEIVDFIKQNHIIIKQLNTYQPTLEDAFLRIIERGGKN